VSHDVSPPVLLLTFNRPDVTERVLRAVVDVGTPRLYVAADGPRPGRTDDDAKCSSVREIVARAATVTDVRTRYRSENLGCRLAVSDALTWFFSEEPEGIVLEDDCLPDPSFFPYCADLLQRYRHNRDVFVISGNGSHAAAVDRHDSYVFSRYNHVWGWASWSRAWQYYDDDMRDWPRLRDTDWLLDIGDGHPDFARYWTTAFDSAFTNRVDTWDYRWTFSCWRYGGLTALPMRNLVKNIGLRSDATHTTDSDTWLSEVPLQRLDRPLRHPPGVERDVPLDRWIDLHCFETKLPLTRRTRRLLRRFRKTMMGEV
jgi:hypothetical protein